MMAFHTFLNFDGTPNAEAVLEQCAAFISIYYNRVADLANLIAIRGGGTILLFNSSPDTWPPDFALFRQGNDLFVSIAGTTNTRQIVNELVGVYGQAFGNSQSQIHGFFNAVLGEILLALAATLPDDFQQCTLHFSGHSLGASTAYLLAIQYKTLYPNLPVHYLGFSPAKSLTSGYFGAQPDSSIFVSHPLDPVPLLPPNNLITVAPVALGPLFFGIPATWRHYARGFTIDDQGSLQVRKSTFYAELLSVANLTAGFTTHVCGGTVNYVIQYRDQTSRDLANDPVALRMLNTVQANPPLAFQFPFNPAEYVDIPFVNANVFLEPPNEPVTPSNVGTLTSVQASVGKPASGNVILPVFSGGNRMSAKITFFYFEKGTGQGFSESWYQDVPFSGVTEVSIKSYLIARMALSGKDTLCEYVRVSDTVTPRLVTVYGAEWTDKNGVYQGSYPPHVTPKQASDIQTTALLCRFSNNGRQKNLYLRGIPDVVVDNGGQYAPQADFNALFDTFKNVVIRNQWGWRYRTQKLGFPVQIVNCDQLAGSGQAQFTFLNNVWTTESNLVPIQITIRGVRSAPQINGVLTGYPNAVNQFTSKGRLAVGLYAGPDGIARAYTSAVIQALDGQVLRPNERAAGRPFGLSRGRSPNRVRG
jgi:Lipase (class 3)